MRKHKIDFSHCPLTDKDECPTSVVILSKETGSRTIIHYNNNQVELTIQDFEKLNLEDYSWVHFEVRPRNYTNNFNRKLLISKIIF